MDFFARLAQSIAKHRRPGEGRDPEVFGVHWMPSLGLRREGHCAGTAFLDLLRKQMQQERAALNASFDRLIERIGFRSNWLSFSQDSRTHFRRKFSWRHQVDWNTEQIFQFHLQSAEIKQGGARQRINQNVEIAAVSIFTAYDRAKHARVGRSK